MNTFASKASLIWNIAEVLRGSWKQHEYQDVILPLVVIKRLDSILAGKKRKVIEQYNSYNGKVKDLDPILKSAAGAQFYNISPYDFEKLLEDPQQIAKNFRAYLRGYSENIREIIEKFDFDKQLDRLEGGNLLYLIIKELNKVNLLPEAVDNHEMGSIFEELLRRFSEQSNETAGEHYTPREVIQTMVEILLRPDRKELKQQHIIKTIYDCACGTGGMLSVGKDYIKEHINKEADIFVYGQELNPMTYAIAKSDMLIKGEDPEKIKGGEKNHAKASTLSNDQFSSEQFDYMLTNPPFGVDWKKDKEVVEKEAARGYSGRFGAGTPRISDGQLLFLQHLIFKMRNPDQGGSRIAIVFNGSPLFTGDAGSGESEIRRWILEHDWLEAIVALPDQLFYNTGINTYIWFLSNRKDKKRKGKVQLIDARAFFDKMRKSLGQKRKYISDDARKKIYELYNSFEEGEYSKIFPTTEFGYRQITVERPLRLNFQVNADRIEKVKTLAIFTSRKNDEKDRVMKGEQLQSVLTALAHMDTKLYKNREEFLKDLRSSYMQHGTAKALADAKLSKVAEALSERDDTADICKTADGAIESDKELKDTENVPLAQDIREYFDKEVKPYVSDAWINEVIRDEKDGNIGKVGYEIPFTRHFYKYEPPRSLEAIEADIEEVENELLELLKKL